MVNAKKREIMRMMEEYSLDILAISQTKVRRKGEWEMEGVKGFKSGGRRAKGGVALLFIKDMWEVMTEHKEINKCMMHAKVKVDGKIWAILSMFAPQAQKREDKEHFWMGLGECIESFKVGERVMVLGDMNAKVGSVRIEV